MGTVTATDPGYRALREGAAWLDLSARGRIRATGEDRVRLLHAMVTNHVQQLEPGQGCYAFFLNAQGRILGDVNLLSFQDSLWLDTEPETRRSLCEHLDRYIIADDVTLEDVTEETAAIGIEGPRAAGILSALGAPVPEAPWSHAAWGDGFVARLTWTGMPGFRIFGPRSGQEQLARQLESLGAAPAGPEAARAVRLELGRPRYGEDITERHLPQETQLLEAVHFDKGCYIGQEIVERVRSRGGVHRFLVRLELEAAEPPAPGTKITSGGREAGEITSAALSPALAKVVALGYVRLNELSPGAPLEAGNAPARITAPRPLGPG